MININNETPVQFSKIPEWCETHLGKPVNRSTVFRWKTRGARGVKLESFLAGGTRFTTEEALLRFFAGSTANADGAAAAPLSSTSSQTQAYLASEGLA